MGLSPPKQLFRPARSQSGETQSENQMCDLTEKVPSARVGTHALATARVYEYPRARRAPAPRQRAYASRPFEGRRFAS